MQDCSISSALAMEILQSCTKPSMYLTLYIYHWKVTFICCDVFIYFLCMGKTVPCYMQRNNKLYSKLSKISGTTVHIFFFRAKQWYVTNLIKCTIWTQVCGIDVMYLSRSNVVKTYVLSLNMDVIQYWQTVYGLYGPRCALSPKRPINLISLSLSWLTVW